MAKKHKGGKHEKTRKTVTAPAPRPPVLRTPVKAAKRIRPARPRAAEPEIIVVFEPELEPEAQGFQPLEELRSNELLGDEMLVEDVLVQPVPANPRPSPYRSRPRPFDEAQSSDGETDFAYQWAEEQVALAMLEAEQAVALCQGYDHLDPFPFLDASSDLGSPGLETLPPFASSSPSMHAMESDSEDEPFAFDHI